MKIQSASLDIPGSCPNQCKFCVSEIWHNQSDMLNNVFKFDTPAIEDWVRRAFTERLLYLKQLGVNTLVLTGTASEPLFNEKYIKFFHEVNQSFKDNKFVNIEVQTSGVGLSDEKLWLMDLVGVKTVSLSLASLDDETNFQIMQTPEKLKLSIFETCNYIKSNGFNLRLSLNINKTGFDHYDSFDNLFRDCKNLKADQVTFRKLYATDKDSAENNWIKENEMNGEWWYRLNTYIYYSGRTLNRLPFGAMKSSICGMSTVVDEDCMNKASAKEDLKYMILRRNCKLYSEWDDLASLIF
jgi:MoaA/NifB/PqqE/SkfB family radical SAM enzyme